jgi:hypothetical protein
MRKLLIILVMFLSITLRAQILAPILYQTAAASGSSIVVTAHTCHGQGAGAVTAYPCSWNTAPVSGETSVGGVVAYSSGETYSVTDTNSATYTANGSQFNRDSVSWTQGFYRVNNASPPQTIFNLTPAAGYPGLMFIGTTGLAGTPDGSCSVQIGSSVSTWSCDSPIVTTHADLIFCTVILPATGTFSTGTGFTLGPAAGTNVGTQYLVQSSSGSITPSVHYTVAGGIGQMVCYAYY